MKSTIGCEPSISRIYSEDVLQAILKTNLQNYSVDNDFYMIKYNGVWDTYDNVSRKYPFLGLPVVDLKALEVNLND